MTLHPWRTTAKLADGREIIYFDESPDESRVLLDTRDLPTVTPTNEARYDALAGEWVGIAGSRQDRTYLPPADACPLCPSRPGKPSEIPSDSYDVVVFENRFPSFAGVGAPAGPAELGVSAPGNGRCEVVCFTSDHNATMSMLPPERIQTVLAAWIDRTAALAENPAVEQVFCFENRGRDIGVTLAHPHGQIYGYPFLTPVTARMLETVEAHYRATGRNLFADNLSRELAGSRVISRNAHWVAFVPFAARWPLEIHLYPLTRRADLTELTEEEQLAFPEIYLDVLHRMEGVFADELPLISAWHQAPVRQGRERFWAHLRLLCIRRAEGKLKYLAGSESGMGAFVNDISPESWPARLL
jgi:UDPglucose--hexose-1-phosphate uridylyltransferase